MRTTSSVCAPPRHTSADYLMLLIGFLGSLVCISPHLYGYGHTEVSTRLRDIPPQAVFFFQRKPNQKGTFLTLAVHTFDRSLALCEDHLVHELEYKEHLPESHEPDWNLLDRLYHGLQGLEALRVDFLHVPDEFCGEELWKVWVERVIWSLRFLRTRKHLLLTFTVEGKVVPHQWPITTHRLPWELQLHVLDHLEDLEAKRRISRALAACCRVCKAWFRICHKMFLKRISLVDPRQLKGLLTTLSSSTHPIGTYIVDLKLGNSLYHIATIYLATRLPSLDCLVIDGGGQSFKSHRSVVAHLKYFRTVTELKLMNIKFQSFWDFRRLVVALPALSNLHISVGVHLPSSDPFQRLDGRVPSLFSTAHNLKHISFKTKLGWNPLWIWILPFPTRHRKLSNTPLLPPILTPHDAETIQKLVTLPKNGGHDFQTFDWSYSEKQQQCKMLYSGSPHRFMTSLCSRESHVR